MLTGHSFVYFGPEKWAGLWRNRQQLLSVFARHHNRVIYVEPRQHLKPALAALRAGGLAGRPALRQVAENLFVFSYPAWAPVSGRFPLDQLGRQVRRAALRRALDRLGVARPLVWFARPDMVDLLDEVADPCLRVYHVVDEYTAYSRHTPESRRRAEQREAAMLRRVDAVIVVSAKLYESKAPFNPHTTLVGNGVNYPAYSAALAEPGLPKELAAIPAPRLGYIGLIGDKLDYELLARLARYNLAWSLVLLGQANLSEPHRAAWETLAGLPNVYRLGPVGVEQVPHYVKGFQVGLMPYRQNRHAENISPLKLYDYLAAGLPVASVDIPAAREFSHLVHLAADPAAFPAAVEAALADTAPARFEARRAAAAQHTWEARAEQISEALEGRMGDVKRDA